MTIRELNIGFIGAGNMNSAIIGGLIQSDFPAGQIMASDPNAENLADIHSEHDINITADNVATATFADLLVIGVKPNHVASVCEEIAAHLDKALVISVAAGITTTQISTSLRRREGIIRVMPNTPCLYQAGMVGLYASENVTEQQRQNVSEIFTSIAELEWFANEDLMDMVTALSGSGPAYFFHFAEAMITAAVEGGMSEAQAKHLVTQTMAGAASMLKQSPLSAAELRKAVTSPGGTTAAALETMYANDIARSLKEAIQAAEQRGKAMSKEN
jgi:pyrroline-5-carboxylate reductase